MVKRGVAAELLIRAECVLPDRRVEGYVLRLGRRDACFVTSDPIESGERGQLALDLPWHLGRLEIPVQASASSRGKLPTPSVFLTFTGVSRGQMGAIERYLTRYFHLVAQLQA